MERTDTFLFLVSHRGIMEVEINTRMLSDGSLLGMVRDISERKDLERQLLEGQERFRLLSESSLLGLI